MPITAKSIIKRVIVTLQDKTNVRWTVDELVRYFNDGQRAVVTMRPDANSKFAATPLVAGARQTIPDDGLKLIDIPRNTGGKAIRIVNREILDAQQTGWHAFQGVTTIIHFTFDPREPRNFYVYPPAAASGASVDVLYGAYPEDITEPNDGATLDDVVGNLNLPAVFSNAVQNYILHRAYDKDAEYTANAVRATKHMEMFAAELGVEINATLAAQPTSTGNPNYTPRPSGT